MSNTAAQIDVARGDVVNLSGSISEYYDLTELTIDDVSGFEKMSSGSDISATVLSAAPADWENYESVLVTLENVNIGPGGEYGQYELANYAGLKLDDELFRYSVAEGDTIEALTGLVYYSYGEFVILPRDADDMTGQVDNGNGGGDPTTATITECRDGTVSLGTTVTTTGIVTNVGGNKLYIQDPAATENGGMLVYFGSTTFTAPAVGDEVTATGELTEYYDVLEVVIANEADFTATGSTGSVSPIALSAQPADWEAYESMLVSLDGVTVTAGPDANGNFDTDWGMALSDYWNADLATGVSLNSTYSITGIVNQYSGVYELLTRDNNDIAAQ
jgi:predicted extracellular nuclease